MKRGRGEYRSWGTWGRPSTSAAGTGRDGTAPPTSTSFTIARRIGAFCGGVIIRIIPRIPLQWAARNVKCWLIGGGSWRVPSIHLKLVFPQEIFQGRVGRSRIRGWRSGRWDTEVWVSPSLRFVQCLDRSVKQLQDVRVVLHGIGGKYLVLALSGRGR